MRSWIHKCMQKVKKNRFIFEELVKRDFKQKYKRTVLGMLWSVLNPMLNLLVMKLVFSRFFGRNTLHYTTYIFAGNIIYSFYREATSGGMNALMSNASIFTKVNVPKYLFLLSKNVSSTINFGLTLIVFFLFAALDHVQFHWNFFLLLYPSLTLLACNVGIGLILSALFVFFRDTQYLYDVFSLLLMYMSAIFYQIDSFSPTIQKLFLLNPVYAHIRYFRLIVLENSIPSIQYHGLLLFYALLFLSIGGLIYKKKNHQFLYYV